MESRERNNGRGNHAGKKGGIKGMLLVLILCCAAMLMAGFRSEAGAQSADTALGKTFPLLASLGTSVIEPGSPIRLVLKWQGEYEGEGPEAAAAATRLSNELNLGEVSREDGEGHLTYRASAAGEGYKTSLFWSELGDGRSYVIVTLETLDLLNAPELQTAAEEVGNLMRSAGITAEWNTSLQGAAREQGAPLQALMLTEQKMNDQLPGLKVQESYEDETTASHSYHTDALLNSVMSGSHEVTMQAAIHEDVQKGSSRITIGFPLITIEY
jgi:hypothetical protein